MKNLKQLISSLFIIVIMAGGCKDAEICEPVTEDLDPISDLVAYLNPNSIIDGNVLMYYESGFLDDVIGLIGAQKIAGDTFRLAAPTANGLDTVEVLFIATPVTTPFYFTSDDETADEIVSKYKVYKNAQCTETVGPQIDSSCTLIKEWSLYLNSEIYGWYQCKKGTSFCIELNRVVGINKLYEDTLCSVLVRTEDIKNFSCTK